MEEIGLWMRQAEDDLRTAESNLGQGIYYAAAFFAQQGAEKMLKALCIKRFRELAKVHDLVFLAKKVNAPEKIAAGCRVLNKAYIEARYPSDVRTPSESFSKAEAENCVSTAKEVCKWAKTKL